MRRYRRSRQLASKERGDEVATGRGTHPEPTPARAPDLVRWGPVVAGAAIGLGVLALLNTLWLAVATGSGDGWVAGNLAWFLGGSAAIALLLAGVLAGALAGVRRALAGLANGITTWGLLFVLSLTASIPGAVNLASGLGTGLADGNATAGGALRGFTVESALWTSFWSLLVGLVLAAVGGLLGARLGRSVVLAAEHTHSDDGPGRRERDLEGAHAGEGSSRAR